MRLEYMLLADKAEGINGKLYLLGGGLDTVRLLAIPSLASYDIVVSVRFGKDQAGSHALKLTMENSSGEVVVGPIDLPVVAATPPEGQEGRVMLVVNGPFPVTTAGTFAWRLYVDDDEIGAAPVTYLNLGLSREELQGMSVGSVAAPTDMPGGAASPSARSESSSGAKPSDLTG